MKQYLKKRKSIICKCKKRKSREKDRAKYGVCYCDAYSFHYVLGIVISNYLYQYLGDAKKRIVRGDWDVIEKHADAIRAYTDTDGWDLNSTDKSVKKNFLKKERAFKKAMRWVVDNWHSLWW